ncbi:Protein kinase of the Mitotic Exit Network [Paramarasmius palmivorus]|uniref:Protein kinase of the Mitotic Exit Network n=1 Tax=Paramarasmius palmivorus TaxID=297713 RepID=A0AAW0BGQ2_9AGAR
MASRGPSLTEMNKKIIPILLVFSQVSRSDIHVRNALGTRKVVRRSLCACELLKPECLVLMLKAVKHLSMNVTLLDVLQNANAIEILVHILKEQSTSPYSTEMSNHIFQTCYNLCRLNKSWQEEAAQAGIVPCLQRVIETKSPLRQFALPILCDLASAGKSCRTLLWQHDGLGTYLKLLEDPYFQVSAMELIISWLQDETAQVEDVLIEPDSISALLDCFVTAKANSFENLLDLFLKITRLSTPITIALTKSPLFFKRIVDRLSHNTKAVVRLNLLRILKTVCEVHPNRTMFMEKYDLWRRISVGVVLSVQVGFGPRVAFAFCMVLFTVWFCAL